jgi:hypothetical protein
MAKTVATNAPPERQSPLEFAELHPPSSLRPGQTVQIKSGQLSGLGGTIVQVNDDGCCLLELVDLGPGVLVTIHSRQLSRA